MLESSALKVELELISDSHKRVFLPQVELKIHCKMFFFFNNEIKSVVASESCGSEHWHR